LRNQRVITEVLERELRHNDEVRQRAQMEEEVLTRAERMSLEEVRAQAARGGQARTLSLQHPEQAMSRSMANLRDDFIRRGDSFCLWLLRNSL
jgi:hypothetical protein